MADNENAEMRLSETEKTVAVLLPKPENSTGPLAVLIVFDMPSPGPGEYEHHADIFFCKDTAYVEGVIHTLRGLLDRMERQIVLMSGDVPDTEH